MSKQKNGKDPIETFFRKKARDYDVPYNPDDWKKLEGDLDRIDKTYQNRMWRRGAAAAAVILFSLLGYFTYQNYSQLNQINELLSARESETLQPTEIPAEELESPEVLSPDSQDQSSTVGKEEFSSSLNTGKSNSENANKDRDQSSSDSELIGISEAVNTGSQSKGVSFTDNATGKSSGLFIAEVNCMECDVVQSVENQHMSAFEYISDRRSDEVLNKPFTASYSQNGTSSDVSNNNHKALKRSRFSVGLVFGPDMSTTAFYSNFYDPGYTLGAHAEYQISRRLSLRAGVQQSKVRYTADSENYSPPYGYWTNGIAADKTLADCLVLDIPISLKYSFLLFEHSRFYATAGLTSYIMLNEEYQFIYDDQQTGRVQSWESRTGTRHWMSNAAFSIGYEWDIHKNWSLRAEPYAKLPLNEIGWGNVNLYSTGSFLSLNYRFN